MPVVRPPKERHSMQDNGTVLKLTIPSNKNFLVLPFLGFWLIAWLVGEVIVGGLFLSNIIRQFSSSSDVEMFGFVGFAASTLFMLAWLGGWTIAGGFAIYTFLWQLVGKEYIEVSYDRIIIKRAIFGFEPTKEYLASHIKNLRVAPFTILRNTIDDWFRPRGFWRAPSGFIAFDYGSKTFRFGDGVDEAEAKQILEKIVTRFSQYRVRKPETG